MRARRADRGVRVRAFAKINLALRVIAARPEGYHELRTTFQSLALHDTLTFTQRPGPFEIEADDPQCPLNRTNLIWKAADSLWRQTRRRGALRDIHVGVRKRIPVRAGLGGGSSDAAATLVALSALWGRKVSPDALGAIAADLGADVPYFLVGGTALGLERGDLLFPLVDFPPVWVVLVQPAFGVSTADAYRWWDERPASRAARTRDLQPGVNDLEQGVVAHHPEIGRILRSLRRSGADVAAMSGSGSAVFGLFATPDAARRSAMRLATPLRRTLVTRTLTRARFAAGSRPLACG
jgi:4-diphosphocytidyl-2-C-methyl-D-erythritol kinase